MAEPTNTYSNDQLNELATVLARLRGLEQNPGNFSMPTLKSTADVLRPPFKRPIPSMVPYDPEAAWNLEKGWKLLPEAYKNLVRRQPMETNVVSNYNPVMQWALNIPDPQFRGLYLVPKDQVKRWPKVTRFGDILPKNPYMTISNPRNAAHELVHAAVDRAPWFMKPSLEQEEDLARQVVGQPHGSADYIRGSRRQRVPVHPEFYPAFLGALESTRRLDENLTKEGLRPWWVPYFLDSPAK